MRDQPFKLGISKLDVINRYINIEFKLKYTIKTFYHYAHLVTQKNFLILWCGITERQIN